MRRLLSFLRLPWIEKQYFFLACLWFWFFCTALRIMPPQRLYPWFGMPMTESLRSLPVDLNELKRIRRTISRIAKTFHARSPCLVHALTAKQMLRRQQIASTLYLGLAKSSQTPLEAHAWLRAGNFYVTGEGQLERYSIVSTFM